MIRNFCFVYIQTSVQISFPRPVTVCSRGFPQSLPVSAGIILQNSSLPLHSTSCRFYHAQIYLSVDTVNLCILKDAAE